MKQKETSKLSKGKTKKVTIKPKRKVKPEPKPCCVGGFDPEMTLTLETVESPASEPAPAPKTYQHWRPWFAWYPVRINGELVWLETVERLSHDHPSKLEPRYIVKTTHQYRLPITEQDLADAMALMFDSATLFAQITRELQYRGNTADV